ncbi:hypothetical protein PAMP_018267 [Pampus punctatissimus]
MLFCADGRLVAQCALLCADQRNQKEEEGAAGGRRREQQEAEQPRHRLSPHFQQGPTRNPLQHFLSGSSNKTSGAGLVSLIGAD